MANARFAPGPDGGLHPRQDATIFRAIEMSGWERWFWVMLAVVATAPRALALEAAAVIHEIQYHPASTSDAEWIELHNRFSIDVDLAGWRLTGGVDFTFPEGTVLAAGGYLVVAGDPAAMQAAFGLQGVLGPWSGNLDNGGETLRLRDRSGRLMDEVAYRDGDGWPIGADGSGSTLARLEGHLPGNRASAWRVSRQTGGTPGADNDSVRLGPAQTVFPMADPWRYHDAGVAFSHGWQSVEYAAGTDGWLEGPGVFGSTGAALPFPIGTVLPDPSGRPPGTRYFQKDFVVAGDPAAARFALQVLVDDGAVIFLNGGELGRIGMPAGSVDAATPAADEVGDAGLVELAVPSGLLRVGTNTLCVEVHQAGRVIGAATTASGLTLVRTGGLPMDVNHARRPGAAPFAKDVIPVAPTHSIAWLNNGTFGNASSWIGNSSNSFCGVGFGATPVSLGSVAWGRDNTGQFTDRCAGTYTLEFTTVPNPDATTTAWTTIGSVTYPKNGAAYAVRHLYSFPAVEATGIRLRCPGNSFTDGAAIDELEAGPPIVAAAPVFRLMATGGTVDRATNLALGATAFAKDLIGNGSYAPTHTIGGLNDGVFGNPNSWIGNSEGTFAGISFPSIRPVGRIAFGRDNTGVFTDRAEGVYTIQYTAAANPGAATPDSAWTTLGTLAVDDVLGSPALRHLIEFPSIDATGIRIVMPDNGTTAGRCIDELEVYGPRAADVVWGAALERRAILEPPDNAALRIGEIAGSTAAVWQAELTNTGSLPIDLAGWILASGERPLAGRTLPSLTLAPGDSWVVDQSRLGFRPSEDELLFLFAPERSGLVDAALVRDTGRARDALGRMLVPAAPSFGAPNAFALVDTVVISEIMYHVPGSDEEWIELSNRGGVPVDLGGWRLSDAIDFGIPAGTILPAAGRLVIARDAVAMRAKWPGVAILGDFAGNLGNDGDRIVLEDALGNPADEVEYGSGGAWPALADGGGSSLELRDADADNRHPGAWVASDESGRSTMQEFSWRVVCTQPLGPSMWNELRLGLLDAGVCLVDDIRVTRDPDGVSQELVRNGGFDTPSSWRLLGNHSGSIVVDGANGSVLRLAATGPGETNHNHAESTFVGNTPLVDGQVHRVSLRARWISGCPKLGVRGYYSRIAGVIDLPVPSRLGTPGAPNPQAGLVGPALSRLRHEPVVPAAGQPVTVRVDATDARGIDAVTLRWRTDGAFAALPMVRADDGTWSATLPGQVAGTVVQFHVEARNPTGGVSLLPASGTASRALYLVDDGQRATTGARGFRVIMRPADSATMLSTPNLLSNATTGATLVVGDADVFYDVGIRLQGSAAGRARDGSDYQGFNIELNPDQPYLGVYRSIGFDRSARTPAVRRPDEIHAKHLFHRAGLPCTRDDLAHLLGPTATYSGPCILQLNGYNADFVRGQFGAEGSVFNLDGTYEPTSTTDGHPESLKNPVPFVHHQTDLTDLGPDKEQYRGFLDIRSGKERDDYAPLIALCRAMALGGSAFESETALRLDVDQWMRCTALVNLLGVDDSWFTGGMSHNVRFFVPTTGKAVLLPWDMDFLLAKGTTAALNLAQGNLRKLTLVPANQRAYLSHVRDLCLTVLDPAYVRAWLAHYGRVTGHDYSAAAEWLVARRTFALSQLPAAVPFAVTTNGGADFAVAAHSVTLAGKGWLDMVSIRRRGSAVPLFPRWTGNTAWVLDLPLVPGANAVTLDAIGRDGGVVGSVALTITDTLEAPTPREFLRVSEVHYHPAPPTTPAESAVSGDGDDFEFVEVLNTGSGALDLGGVRFTAGIRFVFPAGTMLAGGGRLCVARQPVAFAARYGSSTPQVGGYAPDNLSNGGETLTLVDATGAVIQSLAYDDDWAPASDGGGHSLVVRGPAAAAKGGAAAWALGGIGGSPSQPGGPPLTEFTLWRHAHFTGAALADPAVSGPAADPGGLGVPNLLRHAFGLGPGDPVVGCAPFLDERAGSRSFVFRRLGTAIDLACSVESSPDLTTWTPLPGTPVVREDPGDGVEWWELALPDLPAPCYCRLAVKLVP